MSEIQIEAREEQLDTCAYCGDDPGGTFYFIDGEHYCLACGDLLAESTWDGPLAEYEAEYDTSP